MIPFILDDAYFMHQALLEAHHAQQEQEVPVGAVVVAGNQIIGKGHNQTQLLQDATAHAELIAMSAAMQHLKAKYLSDCTLYVTLEPCAMCAGAMAWAQLHTVVFAAPDPRKGMTQYTPSLLHPKTQVRHSVCHLEAQALLDHFFATVRQRSG